MAMNTSMLSNDTNNWFYMDRKMFERVLTDELGSRFTGLLVKLDFDTAVSFMIGETAEEILTKIQQVLSRSYCRRNICHDYCSLCILLPSSYAKLTWFVQRLLIMSPISKPLVKQTSTANNKTCNCIKNPPCSLTTNTKSNSTEKFIPKVTRICSNYKHSIIIVLFIIEIFLLLFLIVFLFSV